MPTRDVRLRREQKVRKLKALRARIDEGVAALERGEFDEVDETDLESYLEKLSAESDKDGAP